MTALSSHNLHTIPSFHTTHVTLSVRKEDGFTITQYIHTAKTNSNSLDLRALSIILRILFKKMLFII